MNIIVTGTSRGIGFELVRTFLENGHSVIAMSRNVKPIEEAFGNNANCYSLAFDLSVGDFDQLAVKVASIFKHVDIVINNAGHLVNKPFGELLHEDLKASYAINAYAPIYLVQKLSPLFGSNAHVVNISSMGGFQGSLKFAGLLAYSSAKAALVCITECLQEEFKETSWSFNCLCLGSVQTEMLENAFPGYQGAHTSEQMATFIADFSLKSGGYFKGKVLPVSISTP